MANKVRVRFVGAAQAAILSNTPDHPSIQFQRYGQLAELDEEVYQKILAGHYGAKLALISDEEFQALKHPAAELTKYGTFESHINAADEFIKRRESALKLAADNHDKATKALTAPAPSTEDKEAVVIPPAAVEIPTVKE